LFVFFICVFCWFFNCLRIHKKLMYLKWKIMTFYLLGNNVRWVKCVFTYATNLTFWYRLSIPLYHHCTMSIEYCVGLFGRCDGHCEINSSMVDEYVTRHRKLAKRTSRQMFFNVPNSRVTYF
jgi:hypothetical protein